jgi:hypothetical protein
MVELYLHSPHFFMVWCSINQRDTQHYLNNWQYTSVVAKHYECTDNAYNNPSPTIGVMLLKKKWTGKTWELRGQNDAANTQLGETRTLCALIKTKPAFTKHKRKYVTTLDLSVSIKKCQRKKHWNSNLEATHMTAIPSLCWCQQQHIACKCLHPLQSMDIQNYIS